MTGRSSFAPDAIPSMRSSRRPMAPRELGCRDVALTSRHTMRRPEVPLQSAGGRPILTCRVELSLNAAKEASHDPPGDSGGRGVLLCGGHHRTSAELWLSDARRSGTGSEAD